MRLVGAVGPLGCFGLLLLLAAASLQAFRVMRARVVHVIQLIESESVHGAIVARQRARVRPGDLRGRMGVHGSGVGPCCGGQEGGACAVSLETLFVFV